MALSDLPTGDRTPDLAHVVVETPEARARTATREALATCDRAAAGNT